MAQRGRPRKAIEMQVCSSCGLELEKAKSFYSTRSSLYIHNGNRLHICKDCVIKMYDEFEKKYKNITVAIYRLCCLLDMYYDAGMLNTIIKNKEENSIQTSIASMYMQKIVSLPQYKELTSINNNDSHMILGRIDKNEEGKLVDVLVEETFEEEFEITPEIIKRFGMDYTKEEYLMLQEKFEELCDSFDTSNPTSVWTYASISKNYVEAERLRKNGNHSGYLKMLESISKMMGDCKIKASQTDLSEEDNACFGNFIKMIENNKPIPEPLDEFKDVDRMSRYFEDFFVKHMKRAFDLEPTNLLEEDEGDTNEN